MVEEIDLCDLSPGEGEVRSRSLGLGVYLCRGQFRDSFASRTKKNGQSWKAGSEQQVCCCTLVQPTPKVYGPGCLTKAEPPRKFPYRPVIGTAAPRRPPPPGRPAGKRPGAVPLPARPLPIQLSSPVSIPSHPRHPRRPPLPAPLKLKDPSDRRSPHRAPGITDLIFSFSQHSLATPSFLSSLQPPPLSRESSPRRQASFGALRQFSPPRRNHETPARLRPPPYHGLPFVTSQRPCRRNGAAPGTFQLSAAAPRQQPKQHVESAERRRG